MYRAQDAVAEMLTRWETLRQQERDAAEREQDVVLKNIHVVRGQEMEYFIRDLKRVERMMGAEVQQNG